MVCVETLADWWNEIGCISSVFSSKARRLKRDKVAKIARLSSCKNFVSEKEKFIFNAFVDL